jgi:putative flippase GtrA
MDRKIVRFFSAGAFNTLLGFCLFPLIYYSFSSYKNHYVIMLILSQFVCTLNSYLTNKYFVFKTKGNFNHEIPRFLVFHVFYFLIASTVIPFFVETWKINPVLIQITISIVVVLSSYFWYDHVAFLSHRAEQDG